MAELRAQQPKVVHAIVAKFSGTGSDIDDTGTLPEEIYKAAKLTEEELKNNPKELKKIQKKLKLIEKLRAKAEKDFSKNTDKRQKRLAKLQQKRNELKEQLATLKHKWRHLKKITTFGKQGPGSKHPEAKATREAVYPNVPDAISRPLDSATGQTVSLIAQQAYVKTKQSIIDYNLSNNEKSRVFYTGWSRGAEAAVKTCQLLASDDELGCYVLRNFSQSEVKELKQLIASKKDSDKVIKHLGSKLKGVKSSNYKGFTLSEIDTLKLKKFLVTQQKKHLLEKLSEEKKYDYDVVLNLLEPCSGPSKKDPNRWLVPTNVIFVNNIVSSEEHKPINSLGAMPRRAFAKTAYPAAHLRISDPSITGVSDLRLPGSHSRPAKGGKVGSRERTAKITRGMVLDIHEKFGLKLNPSTISTTNKLKNFKNKTTKRSRHLMAHQRMTISEVLKRFDEKSDDKSIIEIIYKKIADFSTVRTKHRIKRGSIRDANTGELIQDTTTPDFFICKQHMELFKRVAPDTFRVIDSIFKKKDPYSIPAVAKQELIDLAKNGAIEEVIAFRQYNTKTRYENLFKTGELAQLIEENKNPVARRTREQLLAANIELVNYVRGYRDEYNTKFASSKEHKKASRKKALSASSKKHEKEAGQQENRKVSTKKAYYQKRYFKQLNADANGNSYEDSVKKLLDNYVDPGFFIGLFKNRSHKKGVKEALKSNDLIPLLIALEQYKNSQSLSKKFNQEGSFALRFETIWHLMPNATKVKLKKQQQANQDQVQVQSGTFSVQRAL